MTFIIKLPFIILLLSTGPNKKAIKMSVPVHRIAVNTCISFRRSKLALIIATTTATIGIMTQRLGNIEILGGGG